MRGENPYLVKKVNLPIYMDTIINIIQEKGELFWLDIQFVEKRE